MKKESNKPSTKVNAYPQITRLGINVGYTKDGLSYVPHAELDRVLTPEQREIFSDYFGAQTCILEGLYPWDVEAVLVRMFEERLTGTQLIWD